MLVGFETTKFCRFYQSSHHFRHTMAPSLPAAPSPHEARSVAITEKKVSWTKHGLVTCGYTQQDNTTNGGRTLWGNWGSWREHNIPNASWTSQVLLVAHGRTTSWIFQNYKADHPPCSWKRGIPDVGRCHEFMVQEQFSAYTQWCETPNSIIFYITDRSTEVEVKDSTKIPDTTLVSDWTLVNKAPSLLLKSGLQKCWISYSMMLNVYFKALVTWKQNRTVKTNFCGVLCPSQTCRKFTMRKKLAPAILDYYDANGLPLLSNLDVYVYICPKGQRTRLTKSSYHLG